MTRGLGAALSVVLLVGCAHGPAKEPVSPAAADWRAAYSALRDTGAGQVYRLDAAASRVRIYVFRGGLAAKKGHVHVLSAPSFEGLAYVLPDKLGSSRFDLSVPLAAVTIDDAAVRQETGGAFAGVLDESSIRGTREHMLGVDALDAARFPEIHFHSTAVTGDLPRAVADVEVTLHGVTRSMSVPLEVVQGRGGLQVHGEFVLRQSDFGIKPYSILGGLLALEDPVEIEFTLTGRAQGAGSPG